MVMEVQKLARLRGGLSLKAGKCRMTIRNPGRRTSRVKCHERITYLKKSEQLVEERSTEAYREASKLLADLREALADTRKAGLAEKQARKLKKANPTRHHLTAALRREGFVLK